MLSIIDSGTVQVFCVRAVPALSMCDVHVFRAVPPCMHAQDSARSAVGQLYQYFTDNRAGITNEKARLLASVAVSLRTQVGVWKKVNA